MSIRNIGDTIGQPRKIDSRLTGRILGVGLLFVLWQLTSMVSPNQIVPPPLKIALLIVQLFQEGIVLANVIPTLWRTILAFISAMVLGTSVGVLLGINPVTKQWTIPYLLVALSISGLSSAAIGTLLFGYSILSPIVANTIATFPYIAVNVWKGVESLDADLINMSKAFDVSSRRTILRTAIPHSAPSLFSAFRIGLASSWKIVTVTEVFAAGSGVGYKLIQNYEIYRFDRAWAWGIIFMLIILVIEYGIIQPLERKVFEYRTDADLKF
jgi:ABC-type nitrate/sulfonate/bicarbonate transport system permease component